MSALIANRALQRLREGEVAIGLSVGLVRDGAIIHVAHAAGLHWLALDAEHGAFSLGEIAQVCDVASLLPVAPIVRVQKGALEFATRALDCGAHGILYPMVESAAEARALVDVTRYAPLGARGYGGRGARFRYTPPPAREATELLNAHTLLGAMIETRAGLRNVDEIASVPGIDVLFVGAGDLALDGELGSISEIVKRVAAAAHKHGKYCGVGGAYGDADLSATARAGATLVAIGGDQAILAQHLRARVDGFNALPR